jgi:hypothetical protein
MQLHHDRGAGRLRFERSSQKIRWTWTYPRWLVPLWLPILLGMGVVDLTAFAEWLVVALSMRFKRGVQEMRKTEVTIAGRKLQLVQMSVPSARELFYLVGVAAVAMAGICAILAHATSLRDAVIATIQ